MTEIWKPVNGYEGIYEVSSLGRVRSLDHVCKHWRTGEEYIKEGKIVRPSMNHSGYLQAGLYANGKMRTYGVHRLVAIAFIPNPDNLPQVNHKDEDKTNNRVDNLEWCDNAYNSTYNDRHIRIGEKVHQKWLKDRNLIE